MATTVLLIDDDEDDAHFFSEALDQLPLDTAFEYCSSGEQALQKLMHKEFRFPEIIFLDLNMPVVNGWECLREIKKIAGMQQIPIIMYSTADLNKSGFSPVDVGAAAFYQKSNSFRE